MQEAVILLIEGKRAGLNSSIPALEKTDHEVRLFHTGTAAIAALEECQPDLVIFNASAMRSSGSRTCRRIRRLLNETPIIHIRDEGAAKDPRTEADAYLELPFTPRKLLNRVKALIPADHTEEEIVRYGHISLYKSKRSVEVLGQGEQKLTPKLARLLEEFIRFPNQIVTRRQLMLNVWNTSYVGDTRTLDVHMRWMREAIEEDASNPELLQTVRGKGYIFAIPTQDGAPPK